ncbi:hypothetical protein Ddc_04162 [Ditylenchus destructor]|nr:hypothetical protein Ddc_04162 [Ditylenchus destructor]
MYHRESDNDNSHNGEKEDVSSHFSDPFSPFYIDVTPCQSPREMSNSSECPLAYSENQENASNNAFFNNANQQYVTVCSPFQGNEVNQTRNEQEIEEIPNRRPYRRLRMQKRLTFRNLDDEIHIPPQLTTPNQNRKSGQHNLAYSQYQQSTKSTSTKINSQSTNNCQGATSRIPQLQLQDEREIQRSLISYSLFPSVTPQLSFLQHYKIPRRGISSTASITRCTEEEEDRGISGQRSEGCVKSLDQMNHAASDKPNSSVRINSNSDIIRTCSTQDCLGEIEENCYKLHVSKRGGLSLDIIAKQFPDHVTIADVSRALAKSVVRGERGLYLKVLGICQEMITRIFTLIQVFGFDEADDDLFEDYECTTEQIVIIAAILELEYGFEDDEEIRLENVQPSTLPNHLPEPIQGHKRASPQRLQRCNYTGKNIYDDFHISREDFEELMCLLTSEHLVESRDVCSDWFVRPVNKVLATLHYYATTHTKTDLAGLWGIHRSTASQYVIKFTRCIIQCLEKRVDLRVDDKGNVIYDRRRLIPRFPRLGINRNAPCYKTILKACILLDKYFP